MPLVEGLRGAISAFNARYGTYSRSLDRLNRRPLHTAFLRGLDVPSYSTREAMWEGVAGLCPGAIDYLEFGVHRGRSILYWAAIKGEPRSRFVGFDTFTGLPDTWNKAYPAGHFDTGGAIPTTDDPRISFQAGLFQETLGPFLAGYRPDGRKLVVHIDCDLYASALFCLTKLDPVLARGTVLIFDEFGDVQHEFRAYQDYAAAYRRQARVVCTHDNGFTAALALE